ncbi:MAG: RNA-directed DNA polymerase [Fuerstiella sp.]|nr:RNA-directed DNA polymerase [Fuerstiella sp.]MDG2129789.1 reverse transcriptase family protein [Fuerstiella sp.]
MFSVPVLIGLATAVSAAVFVSVMVVLRFRADRFQTSPADLPGQLDVPRSRQHDLSELGKRLGISCNVLERFEVGYRISEISKPRGGVRRLEIPNEETKKLQRTILRRLLTGLDIHPFACGFEQGTSIVDAATPHEGRLVVVRMDVRRFFESTTAARVQAYFQGIGWDAASAATLARLTTFHGHLPQGAPTSPKLSNLVNAPLDEALMRLARRHNGGYSRYADDITMSFDIRPGRVVRGLTQVVRRILKSYGYTMHGGSKLKILRRHQRQQILGLVVNQKTALPRKTRRWLRAVRHHASLGKPTSLTAQQLNGWESLLKMVETQREE